MFNRAKQLRFKVSFAKAAYWQSTAQPIFVVCQGGSPSRRAFLDSSAHQHASGQYGRAAAATHGHRK